MSVGSFKRRNNLVFELNRTIKPVEFESESSKNFARHAQTVELWPAKTRNKC